MRILMKASFASEKQSLASGTVVDVPEGKARRLIARGYAEPEMAISEPQAETATKRHFRRRGKNVG